MDGPGPRPSCRLAWISRDNEGADHDVESVGDDGDVIYIEVKSTTSAGLWELGNAETEVTEARMWLPKPEGQPPVDSQ